MPKFWSTTFTRKVGEAEKGRKLEARRPGAMRRSLSEEHLGVEFAKREDTNEKGMILRKVHQKVLRSEIENQIERA